MIVVHREETASNSFRNFEVAAFNDARESQRKDNFLFRFVSTLTEFQRRQYATEIVPMRSWAIQMNLSHSNQLH